MLEFKNKRSQKINIIPLIDIIFLMLVFFMLATNFDINKEINFSVSNQKEISDNQNKEKIMLLYLKNNKVFFEKRNLDIKSLENNYLKKWESLGFEKIVILNDKNTSFQTLIMMLDLIKKNKIKNVYFSNENKKAQ
tara:strand:- start:40 stop:447 length:408 start_codon:yes stop_codon:yes gene_type:complete